MNLSKRTLNDLLQDKLVITGQDVIERILRQVIKDDLENL